MCSPDVPDTSASQMAAIQLQSNIADRSLSMQDDAIAYFKDRQNTVDAVANEATRRQMEIADDTAWQGRDQYRYQTEVFRPVEQSLVAEAMADSTPEYYERFASEAMARQGSANANAQAQAQRVLTSMGVNPNSGAFASAQRGLQLSNAAAMGKVGNDARVQAEQLGWARRAEVAGLGKGLVGAGNASYGIASGAATAATGATNGANSQAAGTLGTSTQYGQLGLSAANAAADSYNNIYKTQASAAGGGGGSGLASAAGSALGMWASTGFAT